MEKNRFLSAETVEQSELARREGRFVDASNLSAAGLGLNPEDKSAFTRTTVLSDLSYPTKERILACLARIFVDSEKSQANRSINPFDVLKHLENATQVIDVVHRHEQLRVRMAGVATDHMGRTHYFVPEMARDEAKTLKAAVPLYSGFQAHALWRSSSAVLWNTLIRLPDGHPVKPLIGIEYQINNLELADYKGHTPTIKVDQIVSDFQSLVDSDSDTNPHRVASISALLIAWGERLTNDALIHKAVPVFDEVTSQDPDLGQLLEESRQKISRVRLRNSLFKMLLPVARLSSPITDFNGRRENLHATLVKY